MKAPNISNFTSSYLEHGVAKDDAFDYSWGMLLEDVKEPKTAKRLFIKSFWKLIIHY